MDEKLGNIKDDAANDYLSSRQIAHEYHSPHVQAFINSFSRMIQEPPPGVVSKGKFEQTQEGTPKEETRAETGGIEEPFLDPSTAAAGGFAGAGVMSLRQGMKLMPSLGRAVLSGVVGGLADYPIGAATEAIEPEFPSLALPFNILTGLVSGVTLESAIEKGIIKGLGKAADSDTIRRVVGDMKIRLSDETGAVGKDIKGGKADIPAVSPEKAEGGELIAKQFKQLAYNPWRESSGTNLTDALKKRGFKISDRENISQKQGFETSSTIEKVTYTDDKGIQKYAYIRRQRYDIDGLGEDSIISTKEIPKENIEQFFKQAEIEQDALGRQVKQTRESNPKDELYWVPKVRERIDAINNRLMKEYGGDFKKAYADPRWQSITNLLDQAKEAASRYIAGEDPLAIPSPTSRGSELVDKSVLKSVIESLNDTINNEIGALGDIKKAEQLIDSKVTELIQVDPSLGKAVARKKAIEELRQAGRIVTAVRKGQPKKTGITAEKLENSMQELATKDLDIAAPTEKYVGNININRIDTTDKIKNLIDLNTQQFKDQFLEARRGVRTWEETEKAAKQYTLEDLLGRQPGQAYNAEQSLNARVLQVSSAENIQTMAEKIKTGSATDNDKLEFMQAFGLHYAIMEQVAGVTAEAGRTLNIFRKMAGGGDIKQIREIMKNMPTTPEELADALSTLDSPIQVNKLVKGAMRATTKDMFLEAWINGLLSGPQTHMINTLSNSLNSVWQVPERFMAAMIGRVLPGDQVIKETEALQQAYGLVEGFKDGVKAFGRVVKTGVTGDELTKLESIRYRAITSENVRQLPAIKKLAPNALQEGGIAARAVDFMGEIIRLPGRFLTAEDELFKSVGYRMELRAQAFREAKGDPNRMAEILRDPETAAPNIHLAAIDAARYQTFTNPLESKLLGALSQSRNPIVKLIVPFVRTPTNILKAAFERTPLAALSTKVRSDISAGGARRDLALAKISMGSMMMSIAAIMAAEGKITGGGPSDPKVHANLRRQGWQPYSLKIGDKYVQFGRLEPLGMIFGLAADFAEITGLAGDELTPEAENLASAISMVIARNVTSKTWLKGVSEAVQAMDDPDRYGNKYIQNYARSLVPSVLAQAERSIDPEMEAVYGISDSIKSRIPVYSADLLPRRDLWGDPMTTQIGTGKRSWSEIAYSTLSPIYVSEEKNSPIDKELSRMKIGISKSSMKQSIIGVPMELPPKLFDEFIQLSTKKVFNGKDLKEFLNDFVKSPDYKQMPDERKEEEIRDIMTKARDIARKKMAEKYPQLVDMAMSWKQRLQ